MRSRLLRTIAIGSRADCVDCNVARVLCILLGSPRRLRAIVLLASACTRPQSFRDFADDSFQLGPTHACYSFIAHIQLITILHTGQVTMRHYLYNSHTSYWEAPTCWTQLWAHVCVCRSSGVRRVGGADERSVLAAGAAGECTGALSGRAARTHRYREVGVGLCDNGQVDDSSDDGGDVIWLPRLSIEPPTH